MDDADLSFLSELLSPDPNALSVIPVVSAAPSPSSSIHSVDSSNSADSAQSPDEFDGTRDAQRKRKVVSSPESEDAQVGDRDERRRLLSAKNARTYRSRKKVGSVC